MVDRQIRARGIDDARILAAFRVVPREMFVPKRFRDAAYEDRPLPIGSGQTISQPYVVAAMIAAAELGPADRVLEVGAGSGYAAAVISRLVKDVYAIERQQALARDAAVRIESLGYENCTIVSGDGMKGLPGEAPFDAILVPAASERTPDALKRQLGEFGRLVIPLGDASLQELTCITRTGEDAWDSREISPVRFVPLLSGEVRS